MLGQAYPVDEKIVHGDLDGSIIDLTESLNSSCIILSDGEIDSPEKRTFSGSKVGYSMYEENESLGTKKLGSSVSAPNLGSKDLKKSVDSILKNSSIKKSVDSILKNSSINIAALIKSRQAKSKVSFF